MADLGAIPGLGHPAHPMPEMLPISNYRINRGLHLGTLTPIDLRHPTTPQLGVVSNYVVRQIRIIYRQLWPTHGQRFPQ